MKKILASVFILTVLFAPMLVLAHGGVDDGHEEVESAAQETVAHVHEDGTVDFHPASQFTLAAPWSGRWWIYVGVSLLLMGLLSIWVEKYLHVF